MFSRLDSLLGRITMYRLVLVLLLILAFYAFGLSALDLLAFTPTELGATLAAALIASWGGTRIMALMLRTRPHTESSLITGLLLFFVMFPSDTPTGVGGIALAGLIAAASKYLMAFRGRHIFNPAAFGAVAVTLLGLSAAAWWAANPAMLPLVLIFTLLLLYRTRKLSMGAVFVIVAVGILVVRLMAGGTSPTEALQLVFGSYPVLFLLGFMLTEPLTLPPRRWQQLLIAGIVAVVLALQISIGPVFLGPEFALLIGNAVAFAMGQRRRIRLRYTGSRRLTPTSTEVQFTPERPVRFRPGQYMELTLPHARPDRRGLRRIFSISSTPDDGTVRFGLRLSDPPSTFKNALLQLKPGAPVDATTVAGDFVLPDDPSVPLLLFAGGIGVTPFLSQLGASHPSSERDIVLVYVVSSANELAYAEELADARVHLFCPDDPGKLPATWTRGGGSFPTAEELRSLVPDLPKRRVYLSGSPATLARAKPLIREAGGRSVQTDAFLGY
ncbi:ferredoxin-NADP reductase [Arthrobacter pigmenti]|uniref:Ferredoxin-NADP reductase n=1 Tax=Arthrobacter pigmenti TaxID=271432 RepID=A0A846RRQ9_9MICC|nr:FAD-dependent oxidoreductase [Arthrobacter pigmenti]NJC22837.1 ferredoxin-NADP reductase [Arthrobacter pigmenti]